MNRVRPLIQRQTRCLPDDLDAAVERELEAWATDGNVPRLWEGDATLWTGGDEARWLGWLDIVDDQRQEFDNLRAIAAEARRAGFGYALLLGMGGSSLCAEVLKTTFGNIDGSPELLVLDSTDPAQIRAFEQKIDLERTLFIVSSKSGTTLEPNVFKQYFYERVKESVGGSEAGRRFIAVTDPGSKLEEIGRHDGFHRVFFGVPSIGGRYSALSHFGMVPGAVMGLDVPRLLDRTREMVKACAPGVPVSENPGVVLGATLGVLHRHGRDKITIATSPGLAALGAWLEQLLAESTGKQGKALIPVDGEALGPPDAYGNDRVFVHLRLDGSTEDASDAAVQRLEEAGQPVVRVRIVDRYDLGQEFFRWEMATAVAGAVMRINPFDQPDVESSKVATRKLTDAYEASGALPSESPILEDEGFKLFADDRNAQSLADAAAEPSLPSYLRAHLDRIAPGDYVAILAYIEMNDVHRERLQELRHALRDAKRVATCLGFGPRFLHSTGQAYKGGPNTGVFLQITCDDADDLQVPGQRYSFGTIKAAQARGDFEVLAERERRVLRVHLGVEVGAGLRRLRDLVTTVTAKVRTG